MREDFLQQNAFDDVDTYASLNKQYGMLQLVINFYHEAQRALSAGATINQIFDLPVREKIARAKYVVETEFPAYLQQVETELADGIKAIISGEVSA